MDINNINDNNQHFELWSKDDKGNAEIHLATENKKKELDIHIQKYFSSTEL